MGQGGGCGLCYVEGQPKKEWTCPCGRGYWDAVKQEFISGDLVRRREAPTRADYEAHLRQCPECNTKAQQDDLILPVLDQGEWDRKGYGMGSRPFVEHFPARNWQNDPRDLNKYFLPDKDIKFLVIENDITRYLGPDASVRRGTHPDGRSGFLIRARFPLTVSMIANLKADSNPNYDPQRSNSLSQISGTGTELETPVAPSRKILNTSPESRDSPEYASQGSRYRERAQPRRQEVDEPRNASIDPPDATYGSTQSHQPARGPSLMAYRSPQNIEQEDLTAEKVQENQRTVQEDYREFPLGRRSTSHDQVDPSRLRERPPVGQYRYEAERQVFDPPYIRDRDAPMSRATIPVATEQVQEERATDSREQTRREIAQRLRAAGRTQITHQQLEALVDQEMERYKSPRR